MPTIDEDPFESALAAAIEALPEPYPRELASVAIVIEDSPTPEQAEVAGTPDGWLYGLYEGVPATEWGADWVALPNKISLFRLPLEADFPDPADLEEEVRITVMHELAHHAGIDDERLHELDLA